MTLREHLIKEGYARVFDAAQRQALFAVVEELRREGHAVLSEEATIGDRVTSATAHHYRTCTACLQDGVQQ